MRKHWRQWWLRCHLYLGLSLGFLFSLLGLTGALLVFYLDIETVLEPGTGIRSAPSVAVDLDRVLSTVRAQYPQHKGPWRLEMPLHPFDPVRLRYPQPEERSKAHFAPLLLTMAPDTREVSSQKYWGDSGMTWVYDLHYSLLLGREGKTGVGFAGLFLLVSLTAGLYLWWPRARHAFKALKPVVRSSPVKRIYDVHVLSGVYFSAVLLTVCLTGVVLVWPQETRGLLSRVATLQPPPHPSPGPSVPGAAPWTLHAAAAKAQALFPHAELRWVHSSGAAGEPLTIRLYQPGEPGRRFPSTQVWLHSQTGEVLAVRDGLALPWAEQVLRWMHPLHNGEALGLFGRWLVLLSGLSLPLLWVTGIVRWQHKRAAKRQVRQR